ncbi:MAG: ATP-binding cassette domain-containing protein [Acidimicrobiia bacterium]|nr:ATP-binding cassette domain-containing protein [Acidimicrobiia bacterium]
MPMLIVRDLRIEIGPRTLLDGASFSVQPGDKIGLVGRNGAGKTTLMKTLMGHLSPASGVINSSGKVGYFTQETVLRDLEAPDMTALERILAARDIGVLQRRIEATRVEMAEAANDGDRERLIRRYTRLQDEFEAKGGFVAEAEAKRTAAALGIGHGELSQSLASMSGGQRRRVELSRILFAETGILLLDNPPIISILMPRNGSWGISPITTVGFWW